MSNYFYFLLIIIIFYNHFYKKINSKSILLVAIISCNRYIYLNRTIFALVNHINIYEKNLNHNIIFLDQGTIERDLIVLKYNLHNYVFMNPVGYPLSFNIVFSYLFTKYILLLEEDWEVVKNIERYILHPSFITESILLLNVVSNIYGILLRKMNDITVNCSLTVATYMGTHTLYILQPPMERFSFTNGACVYRCIDLKKLNQYKDELSTSQFFRLYNYKLGFTYKGLKGRKNSSGIQYVMKHIGAISTRRGSCRKWLY